MERRCASSAAFRWTRSPGRPSGACAAIRTTLRVRVGAANVSLTSTAKPWIRMPVEDRMQSGSRRRRRGFTFVELMVVITIIVILVSIAVPIYNRAIIRAKESVLHNNLFTLRNVIDAYTYDKQKA